MQKIKFNIYQFKQVTSTNDIAIKMIKNKAKKAGCIYANLQTKGRGTHGKKWFSNKGNLFSSIFFPLNENYPPFNEFSIINPVIISNVINNFCKKKIVSLKFPNDIFVNGKKICGILQELITLDEKNFLVIGIGINILKQITNAYEDFFLNLSSYNFNEFKKKAKLMALN